MLQSLFGLADEARAAIEPHVPQTRPGARRTGDRRVTSGIIHPLTCGGRLADDPPDDGPPTTVWNRWNRWSRWGIPTRIRSALTEEEWTAETARIDSSEVQAHRSAGNAKGGSSPGPWRHMWWPDGPRASQARRLRFLDLLGRPLHPVLMPGTTSDIRAAGLLIGDEARLKRLIPDWGHDANGLRATLKAQDTSPGHPRPMQPQAADPD